MVIARTAVEETVFIGTAQLIVASEAVDGHLVVVPASEIVVPFRTGDHDVSLGDVGRRQDRAVGKYDLFYLTPRASGPSRDGECLSRFPDLEDKVLVVGSPAEDLDGVLSHPRPEDDGIVVEIVRDRIVVDEDVIARPLAEQVRVASLAAPERIVAGIPGQGVVAVPAVQRVVSVPSVESVVHARPAQGVVAPEAVEIHIQTEGGLQGVVALRSPDRDPLRIDVCRRQHRAVCKNKPVDLFRHQGEPTCQGQRLARLLDPDDEVRAVGDSGCELERCHREPFTEDHRIHPVDVAQFGVLTEAVYRVVSIPLAPDVDVVSDASPEVVIPGAAVKVVVAVFRE